MLTLKAVLVSNKSPLENKYIQYFSGFLNPFYDDLKPFFVKLLNLSKCKESFKNKYICQLYLRKIIKLKFEKYGIQSNIAVHKKLILNQPTIYA